MSEDSAEYFDVPDSPPQRPVPPRRSNHSFFFFFLIILWISQYNINILNYFIYLKYKVDEEEEEEEEEEYVEGKKCNQKYKCNS